MKSAYLAIPFLLACPFFLTPAVTTNPVTLYPVITGTISDETGQPLTGVHVVLLDVHSVEIATAVTKSTGAFQFTKLQPGAFSLVADAPNFVRSEAAITLRGGISAANVSLQLLHPGTTCPHTQCETVTYLKPSQALQVAPLSKQAAAPTTLLSLVHSAATTTTTAATTNAPADFTINTSVAAPAPPRFGFNFEPFSPSVNNMFTLGGGMDPFDARFNLLASDSGTANTFIDNDCAAGTCQGTDFFSSIASGYFNGAQARVYHYDGTKWLLANSGTVTSFTAVSGSVNPTDHTITLNNSGTPTQKGDAIWLTADNNPSIPNFNLLAPRLQKAGYYGTVWNYESGTNYPYLSKHPVNATNLQPYTFAADGPPGDNDELPGANSPLSLKITDDNAEYAGISQGFITYGSTESLQVGHTYQVSVWLKQTGIANGSVYFLINSGSTKYAANTFTGVTGTWQQFTFQFPGFQQPPKTEPVPLFHIDFQAPGTLYIDQLQVSDTGFPALTIDPRVLAEWQTFAPGTIRFWSNFENSSTSFAYWGLDSWLANDTEDHADPGIGNIYETVAMHSHLPTSLAIAKSVGADPWFVCNMSLTEAEWGNLIDYLAAPAGTGYASLRPANHPGPYTADFDHIFLEFGDEEWGTQETAVNAHYGQWVHYMLSQAIAGKSYFDPNKIKFVLNGFTLLPYIGSTSAQATPEVSTVDLFTYNSGDTSLIPAGATTFPDAYYQTDLLSLIRYDATYKHSLQSLLDAQIKQQQKDAKNGLLYNYAVYEGGPGGDIASETTVGDTSLAAAVGNLDTFLYSSLLGIQQQNFFFFNFGTGRFSSHGFLWDGFRPHPVWQALQMRNQYAHGDMVNTTANTVPVTNDGNAYPLIATYAFHEVNAAGQDQVDVFVLSRDLNNTTPVTLRLPGVPTGAGTLYTLTGDPRTNNDTALTIPIAQSTLTGVTQNYQFNMPPVWSISTKSHSLLTLPPSPRPPVSAKRVDIPVSIRRRG